MSERVLAIRKVDDVIGTVRYCPDPEAPSVAEVVEVLRKAQSDAIAPPIEGDGTFYERIGNLIARLESD